MSHGRNAVQTRRDMRIVTQHRAGIGLAEPAGESKRRSPTAAEGNRTWEAVWLNELLVRRATNPVTGHPCHSGVDAIIQARVGDKVLFDLEPTANRASCST